MKVRNSRVSRGITAFLTAIIISEQFASGGAVLCSHAEEDKDAYYLSREITASWDGGYNAELSLENLSEAETMGWTICFCTSDEITGLWGGRISECLEVPADGSLTEDIDGEEEIGYNVCYQYTVTAEDYNAVIAPGEKAVIGYSANGNSQDFREETVELEFSVLESLSDEETEDSFLTGDVFVGDGYRIETVVSDSWNGAYNLKILITNTGEETIHNWGFLMETQDTVSGLYNALELADNDGVRLIKNAGYNQDISAGETIEVGYTAFYQERVDIPKAFALSHIEKEVETADCEVSLFITDEWEDGGMAQLIIDNISGEPIEDWMLEFDSELSIAEIWGGVIESHEEEHFFIRNVDYAQNIPAGEAWTVGILFTGDVAEIRNVAVRQIVVTGEESQEQHDVSPTPTGIPSSVEDVDIDYEKDTDDDGIPDVFEEMFGTNALVPDTDNDDLDDYVEIFVIGSDPLVYDSIEAGVSDGNADSDSDGISNMEEIRRNLNPVFRDTDYDGLDDFEETKLGTDPCNPDSDYDGLKDGEEIKLGLNPLNPVTNGTADGKYVISQMINADSESLRRVNTKDNPYRFSAEVKAAGYVEGNIDVCESLDTAVIKNDAMLGMAIHLYYDSEETIESIRLNFQLEDDSVAEGGTRFPDNAELKGIRRYNVFHYFGDRHMLLPVETFFDEDNNTVYAITDELGTYCLMDMEKVFEKLGEQKQNGIVMGASIVREGENADLPEESEQEEDKQVINLFFVLYREGRDEAVFERQKKLIPDLLEKLQNENDQYSYRAVVLNPKTCISDYDHGRIVWYDDPEELRNMISQATYTKSNNNHDFEPAYSVLYGMLYNIVIQDRSSRNYVYTLHSSYLGSSRSNAMPATLCQKFPHNLVYSEIGKYVFQWQDDDPTDEYETFVEKSGGQRAFCVGNVLNSVYAKIISTLPVPEEGTENNDQNEEVDKEIVNLFFILQKSGLDEELFQKQERMIPELLEKLQNESTGYEYRVSVIMAGDDTNDLLLNESDTMWFEDAEDLRDRLSIVAYSKTYEIISLAGVYNSMYWYLEGNPENRNYVFLMKNGSVSYDTATGNPQQLCKYYSGRINYSEIGSGYGTDFEAYRSVVEESGGHIWNFQNNMVDIVYAHICGLAEEIEEEQVARKSYPMITLTGWNVVELGSALDENSGTDTDGDTLTDWEEVDTAMLQNENGEYILPSLYECINSSDKPYVKNGLERFNESVLNVVEDTYQIQEIFRQTRVLPILSNPLSVDSDGDGFDDKNDTDPLVPIGTTVYIPNIYEGLTYLNVDGLDGGDQIWWEDYLEEGDNFWNSEEYRIASLGCGVIAMSDLEIYLTQQNNGYHAPGQTIRFDSSDGYISRDDYVDYVEYNVENVYKLNPNLINKIAGLTPIDMILGIEKYLKENSHPYQNATWAPDDYKEYVIGRYLLLGMIENMINNGIPVVFSYYSPGNPLVLYKNVDDAMNELDESDASDCDDHYMTIVGLIKYRKDNEKEYGYLLKTISWGKVYFVNYDSYASKISCATNILYIGE